MYLFRVVAVHAAGELSCNQFVHFIRQPSQMTLRAGEWDATLDSEALLSELLDEATNETDALLAELLNEEPTPDPGTVEALINETVAVCPPTLALPTPRIDKTKHALQCLRLEVNQLTRQLKRMQDECDVPQRDLRTAMASATAERLKRRRAEHECRQLRAAVYAQTQFVRGLKSVLSTPVALSVVDLSHFLHSYTRLPRDRPMRWHEYAELAQETRMQSAVDLLCRETQRMTVSDERREMLPSLDAPLIQTELIPYHDGFSMTSTNVYALQTDDLSAALRGVCVAVREIVTTSQAYECVSRKKQIVDLDAALPPSNGSSLLYRVMGVDHKNPRDGDELSIESRNVILYKQTESDAVLLEDFVDDDELHPHDETTNITRQVVGAYLIRRELCSDGLVHTVVRALRTRRYRFHEHTPPAVLERYQQLIATTMRENDLVFRGIIKQSIQHEERTFAQALDQLGRTQRARG